VRRALFICSRFKGGGLCSRTKLIRLLSVTAYLATHIAARQRKHARADQSHEGRELIWFNHNHNTGEFR
jgi:hypothetical protein